MPAPVPTAAGSHAARLSADEVAAYRRDGIVIPRYRLPEVRVAHLRRALDRLLADNPTVRPEHLVNAHIARHGPEGVRGQDAFFDLATSPDVLDLVEHAIGPDIVLWGCQVFCKPAGDGMEVPWHQDGHYWPIRPLATCTVWVAIDDSTTENGCMRVIPGSHRRGLLPHAKAPRERVVLDLETDPTAFDASTARDVVLEAGQMSMHDVYLIHGSRPNTSPRRRAGVAVRFMPATSRFDRTVPPMTKYGQATVDFSKRPIWLVRGVDRAGNDFEVGH
jgi:ectoine hydroxylase-related dioxygenase (phytanoyl-CoA dioxygenase family)